MDVKTPKEFFEKVLPAKFDPNKATGIDAVVQLNKKSLVYGTDTISIDFMYKGSIITIWETKKNEKNLL